jgi:hypothetical protein
MGTGDQLKLGAEGWKGRGCVEVARHGRDDEGGEARGGKGKGRRVSE